MSTVEPLPADDRRGQDMMLALIEVGIVRLALTPQQAEVARRFATGSSKQQIAEALGLSAETVKGYLQEVYRRTGATSAVQLLRVLLGAPPVAR